MEFADRRLLQRYATGRIRRLVIYHPNDQIRLLNEKASHQLNDRGCRLLNESLVKLDSRISNLKAVNDGVKEVFANGSEKVYTLFFFIRKEFIRNRG